VNDKIEDSFAHERHEAYETLETKIGSLRFSREKSLVFQSRVMPEVYEQGQFATGRAEVIQNLGTMLIN